MESYSEDAFFVLWFLAVAIDKTLKRCTVLSMKFEGDGKIDRPWE